MTGTALAMPIGGESSACVPSLRIPMVRPWLSAANGGGPAILHLGMWPCTPHWIGVRHWHLRCPRRPCIHVCMRLRPFVHFGTEGSVRVGNCSCPCLYPRGYCSFLCQMPPAKLRRRRACSVCWARGVAARALAAAPPQALVGVRHQRRELQAAAQPSWVARERPQGCPIIPWPLTGPLACMQLPGSGGLGLLRAARPPGACCCCSEGLPPVTRVRP